MRPVLTVLLFSAVACLPAASFAEQPVKIGVIESQTGLAAEDGINVVRALKLAAKDLNARGNRVELLIEDDKSSPKDTVSAYQKLKNDGVQALIVGPYSFTTESILPLADRDKLPVLNSSTLVESFNPEHRSQYFFNNGNSLEDDIVPFQKLLESRGVHSAVLVSVPSSWGRVQQKRYAEILKDRNIALAESVETQEQDNNEWKSIVAKLVKHKPDLVVLLLNKTDIAEILKRFAEQKFTPLVFGSKNTFDAWRADRYALFYSGVCFSYPYEPLRANKRFVETFTQEYGEEPRVFADSSYDAVRILAEAAELAERKKTPLIEALQTVEVSGIVGKYRHSAERSFAISKSSLQCIENGDVSQKWPIVEKPAPATPPVEHSAAEQTPIEKAEKLVPVVTATPAPAEGGSELPEK